MRPIIWIASILFIAPVWSQHARRSVDLTTIAQPESRSFKRGVSRIRPLALSATPNAAAPLQAPGVIQTNLFDASNVVWFVTAEKLPSGTRISPFLVFPDQSELPLDSVSLTEEVAPGTSFDLPNIRRFGPFWPAGLLTYGVAVNINGRETQAVADFPVASARNYDDVTRMVPRISSSAEGVTNRDVILSIRGTFRSDPAYVLLEDLVVPSSAVRVSSSEIAVNLSRVPGLDLASMWEYLLTVGQSGWCDTAIFRHTPARPGTYNQAPR